MQAVLAAAAVGLDARRRVDGAVQCPAPGQSRQRGAPPQLRDGGLPVRDVLQTATFPAESVGLGGSVSDPPTSPAPGPSTRAEGGMGRWRQPVAAEIRNSNAAGSSARISGPVSNDALGICHSFELLKLNAAAGRWGRWGGGVAKEVRFAQLCSCCSQAHPNTLNRNPSAISTKSSAPPVVCVWSCPTPVLTYQHVSSSCRSSKQAPHSATFLRKKVYTTGNQ